MSSFNNPHRFYLFDMKNGKKKLSYGPTAEEAYEVLALRLSPEEMESVIKEQFTRIAQRNLSEYVSTLG